LREDHELVEFGVPVEIGGEMRDWPVRGTVGRSAILEDLSTACEAFNMSSAALRTRYGVVKVIESATPSAELYAAILRTTGEADCRADGVKCPPPALRYPGWR
jgi:hypothetical protein